MTTTPFPTDGRAVPVRRHWAALDGWTVFTVATALLLGIPVIAVLANVFVPAGEIWDHLSATVLPRYVTNSMWLIVGVGAGTLVIGTGTAWLVTMCRFPGRPVFEWALLLPLAVPAYVIAYCYTGLFDFAGPAQTVLRESFGWSRGDYWFPRVRSLGGAIAIMTLVLYPYVYMLARAAFLEQSVCALEASRILGRGPWRSFLTVALPLARPAVAAGVALALMEALNDFGAVQYFAVDTFTTGIYRTWFGLGEPAAAAQLAAILLAFIFVLFVLERVSRGRARYHQATGQYKRLPGYRLSSWRAALAFIVCALPIALGFLVPGAMLARWAAEAAEREIDARFFGLALNSFVLAGLAALLAVVLAVLMGYGRRLRPVPAVRLATRAASMGYAVPGSVIAVGVMLPFAWVDNTVDAWMRANLDVSTGLILSGTIVALVFAYLVRFLAVSFNAVEASLAGIRPSLDDAARTLGVSARATLVRVHLPIMRGSLLTAAMLVFVEVMKELPATLIMRPFNFDTLAVRVYQLASDESLAEASCASVAIVLVGIIPVVLMSRSIARARPGGGAE